VIRSRTNGPGTAAIDKRGSRDQADEFHYPLRVVFVPCSTLSIIDHSNWLKSFIDWVTISTHRSRNLKKLLTYCIINKIIHISHRPAI
jgi:hypothetical protein